MKTCFLFIFLSLFLFLNTSGESGYEVWLRYTPVNNPELRAVYLKYCREIHSAGESDILTSSVNELTLGLTKMLGVKPLIIPGEINSGIVIGVIDDIAPEIFQITDNQAEILTNEGFIIKNTGKHLIITGKSDAGVLYGTFHFLRLLQMHESILELYLIENPEIGLRLLNHWDNPGKVPDGQPAIERGYAGGSIFKWDKLPATDPRYVDYSRILASVGINGTVINNVNTAKNKLEGWKLLTPEYLPKLKALADVFRKYGIKLYISVNFFSPVLISGMDNADPLNPGVQKWWKNKVAEIYSAIPDFGGFLVKADSEGEPGPIKYGRTHADGANLLANVLQPFGGLLVWRAFVYGKDQNMSPDRAFQAYEMFKPLDGSFAENALVQIKNGPIDFQVREPVSPLFGAMPETNLVLELQITQEYTGQDKHVCYLVPQWKEILDFDTHSRGPNSAVGDIISSKFSGKRQSGIAGVSNIGDDTNWTGHLLSQANLFGFGRLAWDPDLTTDQITSEWITQTFGNDSKVSTILGDIMKGSWKTYEKYTSPLGVGLMCDGQHFLPGPAGRVNYHKADKSGVGYDRTMATGSGFTGQFHEPVRSMYESLEKCPDELLLFFHHVPYNYKLKSGKSVIRHIYDTHNEGVEEVRKNFEKWQALKGLIDDERFMHIQRKLKEQIKYAEEWRESVNSYFLKQSSLNGPMVDPFN